MLQTINYVLQCTQDTDENVNAFNNGNIEQFINNNGILIVPCGVTEITDKISTYANKDNIIKVQIPDSVTSIGDNSFKDCKNIQSADIPDTVTNIGQQAFFNCTSLSTVNIPTNLTILKAGVFGSCDSLKKIIIPRSIKEGQTVGLIIDNKLTNYGPFSYSGLQEIIFQDNVTNIGNYISINIPNSITSIGKSAFLGCTGLTSIIIPDSVTSIGSHVFYTCDHLVSATISNSVTTIEESTFQYCSRLVSVILPNQLITIKKNSFYYCKSLQSINIPSTVTIIEDYVFNSCFSLESIIIPDGITTIGIETFKNCTSLKTVSLPDTLTVIKRHAFSYCEDLQNIIIPKSVHTIEYCAFTSCKSIQFLDIPYGVTIIEQHAFSDCINLQAVIIPNNVTKIVSAAFQYCSSLQSIIIPSSVTSIGQDSFGNCTNLQCVQIEQESCSINQYAFNSTKYQGKTDPLDFDDQCDINIYTECKNDDSDYHVINSDKCVSEVFVEHYIVENGIKYYQEQCPETHQLTIYGSKECLSECPQYYEQQDNECISVPCLNPDNYYINEYIADFKQCIEDCPTVWKQQNIDNKSVKICLIDKNDCQSVENYTKQINNQCVSKCSDIDDYYQQSSTDNKCVKGCNNGKTGDELIQYVWYTNDIDNICTTQTTCSNASDSQTNGYGKQIGQQCVQQCKDIGYFQIDRNSENICIQQCDNGKVWYSYNLELDNQKENICTQLEKCDLSDVAGYENLNKNQNQQCVERCLDNNQIEYVYYYESDERGNICTETVTCEIPGHENLNKNRNQQCVEQCEQNEFIQDIDNKCLTSCSKNGDKQLYQYQDSQYNNIMCTEKTCQQLSSDTNKYYIYEMTDDQIYCVTSCNNDQFNDKPYIFIFNGQEMCVDKCPDNYKLNEYECVEKKQDNNKLKAGAIVGIIIGAIVVIVIIIVTIVYIKKCKQTQQNKEGQHMSSKIVEKA